MLERAIAKGHLSCPEFISLLFSFDLINLFSWF